MIKWLRERKVELLEWPGDSLDLSLIENFWQHMKIMSRKKIPNLVNLKTKLAKLWYQEMTLDHFRSFSNSTPKCLQRVLKTKGGIT